MDKWYVLISRVLFIPVRHPLFTLASQLFVLLYIIYDLLHDLK
jgi:hypothetical protein